MKNLEIIGGGTVSHVRNHLALTAPAYGKAARTIEHYCWEHAASDHYNINLHLTKMAAGGKSELETNEDISKLVDKLIGNPDTRIIFFNPALVDYNGYILTGGSTYYEEKHTTSGKYEKRLQTAAGLQRMALRPSEKIISKIRKERKDIFLVAFKTTCGASEDEQFLTGLHLLKTNSCNLVVANDTKTRKNMIITPEQARYCVTEDREKVLSELVQMTLSRADAKFTRSIVAPGEPVPWKSKDIPLTLRVVVDHCIEKGAYKTFNQATVGHFAVKVNETDFITSKRKVDFNHLSTEGMVLCRSTNEDTVTAFGHKPSVGGQSQRIIFKDHPGLDCIVHFHCPMKPEAKLSVRAQKYFECGSHECGKNTSIGLVDEGDGIKCVYLDNHGPNIVFNRDIHPQKVIDFIEKNFDLSKSTDQVEDARLRSWNMY